MRISDWSPDVCSSDLSRHDRRIIGQTSDIADERAIDLQRIDGELPKVRQRRKARSEIIKRDIDAIFVQLPDRTFGIFRPASQEHALSDFDLELAWRNAGLFQLFDNPIRQNMTAELRRRGIDRDMPERKPHETGRGSCRERVCQYG